MKRLKALSHGDFEVILSGGEAKEKTSVIIIVQREEGTAEDSFRLTLVNRSPAQRSEGDDGLIYHPYFLDSSLQVLRKTVLTFQGIPGAKIIDEAVLYELMKEMSLMAKPGDGLRYIYEVIMPHLAGRTRLSECAEMAEARQLDLSGAAPPEFEASLSTEQPVERRWKTLERAVAHMLSACGATNEEVGQVLLEMDLIGASRLRDDMELRRSEFQSGVSTIIKEYCRYIRIGASQGFRSCCGGGKAQELIDILDQMEAQSDRIVTTVDHIVPPVLELWGGAKTASNPWVLNGMCQRAWTDEWAGPVMETGSGSFVDMQLTLPEDAAKTPEVLVTELIHACAAKCVHLESKGHIMGLRSMMLRVAAIVEHCFLERLRDLPQPPGDPVMLEDVPQHALRRGDEVRVVKRQGKTLRIQRRSGGDAVDVPAGAVGDDPEKCVYRRLWTGQRHQTLQNRMLQDLHIISAHYAMAVLSGGGRRCYLGDGVLARTATTFLTILCVMDASLRAKSPNNLLLADILRGNVLEDPAIKNPEFRACVPLGFSTSTLSGVDVTLLMSNLESCNPDVLRCRAKVLAYIQVVEKLARPPKPGFIDNDQSKPEGPWLLCDWKPDREFTADEPKCIFYPSLAQELQLNRYRPATDVNLPVAMSDSGKRDDVTLCMLLACVCQYIPNPKEAKPDRPKYLGDLDDFGGSQVGPMAGPGMVRAVAREDRDESAQGWMWHRWKKNEEVHMACEVVWMCRAVLEDCLVLNFAGQEEGLKSHSDKIKTAYTPNLILPKWLPVEGEMGDPRRLAVAFGNLNASETSDGKQCACGLPSDDTIQKGATSVFEELAMGVIGSKDDLEEPPEKEAEPDQEEAEDVEGEIAAQKPARVRLLSRPKPLNEHDVLTCDQDGLNRYDNQLSIEEAEHVHCILTTPRLCIPLLVQWFGQDRHGKLLQDDLRNVFHRALFEPGEFLTEKDQAAVFGAAGQTEEVMVPLQLPEKPTKATQMDEDRHYWGRYTEYYRKRAKFGTECGRFFEELKGPSAKELLASWNRIAYGASSLAKDSYRAAAVKLVEYFCRIGCELARLIRQNRDVLARCKEEYEEMVEWLGTVCVQHLRTYISKVEADPHLGGADRRAYLHKFQLLLVTLSEWKLGEADTPVLMGSQLAIEGKDEESQAGAHDEEAEAYDSYSLLVHEYMLSAAWLSGKDTSSAVEAALCRSRPKVLAWAEDRSRKLDGLLSQIVAMARGQAFTACLALPEWGPKWAPAKAMDPICEQTLESAHPMTGGISTVDVVSFPGAPYISITFDAFTDLDENSTLMFYKDAACREAVPNCEVMSGSALSGDWPGIAGKQTLNVFAETVYYKAVAAVGSEAWGFKFRATAPVSEDGCARLEEYASKMHIAELALAEMQNDVERAQSYLMRSCQQLTAKAKSLQEASSGGLFTDETEREQVSLQTGEVFFDNKPPLAVPTRLRETADFQAVFGDLQPRCTVVEDSSHRVWYQVADNTEGRAATYMLRQWKSRESCYLQGGDATDPAQDDKKKDSKKKEETPWGPAQVDKFTFALLTEQGWPGYPRLVQDQGRPGENTKLRYLDSTYERMHEQDIEDSRKKNRVMGRILQIITWTHPQQKSGDKKVPMKNLWKILFREATKENPRHLMYIRPPDGSMGAFVHIVYHDTLDVIEFFGIYDSGRRACRRLVCSSNFRLSLAIPPEDAPPARTSDGGMPFIKGSPFSPLYNGSGQKVEQPESVVIERSLLHSNTTLERLLQEQGDAAGQGPAFLPAGLLPLPPFPTRGYEGEDAGSESKDVEIYCHGDLFGSIPESLRVGYEFWRRGPNTIMGYPRRFDEKAYKEQNRAIPWWAGSAVIISMGGKDGFQSDDTASPLEVETQIYRVPWRNLEDSDGCAGLKVASRPLVLLNLMAPPKGSLLESVARLLARMELLSHALVWSSTVEAKSSGESREISFIQLPRLGLNFLLRTVEGEPRLECAQRSGMYIKARLPQESSLDRLGILRPWWPYILLESGSGRTDVLMANYKWDKIQLPSNPTFARCTPIEDGKWREEFKDKFFVYSVHPSCAYLVGTPAQLLFPVYLHLMSREYGAAHQLVGYTFGDSTGQVEDDDASRKDAEIAYRRRITEWIRGIKESGNEKAHVRIADMHSFLIRLDLAAAWVNESLESYALNFRSYLEVVQAGKVSAECRVPIDQELVWLSQYKDSCKDVNSPFPQDFEYRTRLMNAQKFGDSQFEVELDRSALQKDGGKSIGDIFAKSAANLDDALTRLSRTPPSQAPYQLVAAKAEKETENEDDAKPEQVKLTWKQAAPADGEATILGWRIFGKVAGEGLDSAYARRKEQRRLQHLEYEKRMLALGMVPRRLADSSQDEGGGGELRFKFSLRPEPRSSDQAALDALNGGRPDGQDEGHLRLLSAARQATGLDPPGDEFAQCGQVWEQYETVAWSRSPDHPSYVACAPASGDSTIGICRTDGRGHEMWEYCRSAPSLGCNGLGKLWFVFCSDLQRQTAPTPAPTAVMPGGAPGGATAPKGLVVATIPPTQGPTVKPTAAPSAAPTPLPTSKPTAAPSRGAHAAAHREAYGGAQRSAHAAAHREAHGGAQRGAHHHDRHPGAYAVPLRDPR
ncbi:unnamed protein product [Prorocentrum cordatum]|uniref:Calmodulin n=1 Tax=Prorocentrum cordatum TaxID=2364126 RepID=A0ABN9Q077_9DINO|nr:unnamed protein product [Polarella glacialis]